MSMASKGSGYIRPMGASGRHGLSLGMSAVSGRQGMLSTHPSPGCRKRGISICDNVCKHKCIHTQRHQGVQMHVQTLIGKP